MALRFPTLAMHSCSANASDVASRLVEAGDDAFARAEGDGEDLILVVRAKKAIDAASWNGSRFAPIPIYEFFARLQETRSVEVCGIAPAVGRVLPLLFRSEPKVRLHSGWLEAKPLLLATLAREKKSVVLTARRGAAVTLAICPDGVPAWIFPGPGELLPEAPAPADRLAAYCVMNADSIVETWDDVPVEMPAARDLAAWIKTKPPISVEADDESTPPPDEHAPAAVAPSTPMSLVVTLGDRVMFRWEVTDDRAFTIGRGGDADVHLENLGVSRKHARARRIGDHLLVEDLGSENGMTFKGERVSSIVLTPGDRLGIGKYVIGVGTGVSLDELLAPSPAKPVAVASPLETFAIPTHVAPVAHVEHEGATCKIAGLVFTIGSAPEANLRITGFLIAPTHVRILRNPDGSHLVTHIAGARRMRVNGLVTKEAILTDGDAIEIGGHREPIVFRQPAALAAPRPALLHAP